MFGLYISVDGADALGLALGDRGVYEHLFGLNVLLAGANGLRSASEASAKQTMSGGREVSSSRCSTCGSGL